MSKTRRECLELLGLPPSASEDDIKKAYRQKALELHPDKNRGAPKATEMFQEIQEAYQILRGDRSEDRHGFFEEEEGIPCDIFWLIMMMERERRRKQFGQFSGLFGSFGPFGPCSGERFEFRTSSFSNNRSHNYRPQQQSRPAYSRGHNAEQHSSYSHGGQRTRPGTRTRNEGHFTAGRKDEKDTPKDNQDKETVEKETGPQPKQRQKGAKIKKPDPWSRKKKSKKKRKPTYGNSYRPGSTSASNKEEISEEENDVEDCDSDIFKGREAANTDRECSSSVLSDSEHEATSECGAHEKEYYVGEETSSDRRNKSFKKEVNGCVNELNIDYIDRDNAVFNVNEERLGHASFRREENNSGISGSETVHRFPGINDHHGDAKMKYGHDGEDLETRQQTKVKGKFAESIPGTSSSFPGPKGDKRTSGATEEQGPSLATHFPDVSENCKTYGEPALNQVDSKTRYDKVRTEQELSIGSDGSNERFSPDFPYHNIIKEHGITQQNASETKQKNSQEVREKEKFAKSDGKGERKRVETKTFINTFPTRFDDFSNDFKSEEIQKKPEKHQKSSLNKQDSKLNTSKIDCESTTKQSSSEKAKLHTEYVDSTKQKQKFVRQGKDSGFGDAVDDLKKEAEHRSTHTTGHASTCKDLSSRADCRLPRVEKQKVYSTVGSKSGANGSRQASKDNKEKPGQKCTLSDWNTSIETKLEKPKLEHTFEESSAKQKQGGAPLRKHGLINEMSYEAKLAERSTCGSEPTAYRKPPLEHPQNERKRTTKKGTKGKTTQTLSGGRYDCLDTRDGEGEEGLCQRQTIRGDGGGQGTEDENRVKEGLFGSNTTMGEGIEKEMNGAVGNNSKTRNNTYVNCFGEATQIHGSQTIGGGVGLENHQYRNNVYDSFQNSSLGKEGHCNQYSREGRVGTEMYGDQITVQGGIERETCTTTGNSADQQFRQTVYYPRNKGAMISRKRRDRREGPSSQPPREEMIGEHGSSFTPNRIAKEKVSELENLTPVDVEEEFRQLERAIALSLQDGGGYTLVC